MLKFKMAIVDNDSYYANALMDYVQSFHSHRFEILSFTDINILNTEIQEYRVTLDILLINSEINIPKKLENCAKFIICLTNGRVEAINSKLKFINKYQNVELIIKSILDILSSENVENLVISKGNKNTKIISVSSAEGGCGKTTLAKNLSVLLQEKGYKTFYLGFDPVDNFSQKPIDSEGKSLSRVIYYLKDKSANISLKIEASRCIDSKTGVHFFKPVESPIDLEELGKEQLLELIKGFRCLGEYDFVLIDEDQGFDSKKLATFFNSDFIIFVSKGENVSFFKTNEMLRKLESIWDSSQGNIQKRLIYVTNNISSSSFEVTIPEGFTIPQVSLPKVENINLSQLNIQNYPIDYKNGLESLMNMIV